ncbi:MAG: phosphate acyltransferase [Pseudomonadota bacterium]
MFEAVVPETPDALDRAFAEARGRGVRVVFPEGEAPVIREAAAYLAAEGLANPVLIGGEAPGCETVSVEELSADRELSQLLMAKRSKLTEGAAQRLLTRPGYLAGAMVAAKRADAMIAGAVTPTKRVIEAASLTVGLAEGVKTPSSFFLMGVPGRPLIFADCGFNVSPTAEQLADIAVASARSGAALLGEARTAFLSYSTLGSGAGPEVDRVIEALGLARAKAPDLSIDGEFQADTALNGAIAAKKGAVGAVAGQANVLIFPNLEAGNIAYKLVQELAGAQAIGPILQGFARPVADLSRGATVQDVVAVTVLTLALG